LICQECIAGFDNRCKQRKVSGYKTPGTFQQYIISDPRYVTPIPDGLSSETAAPLLCGDVTVWSALLFAECKLGDWILISGAGGGLGHLALQYANAFNLRVIAVDNGTKGEFCKSLGAEVFLDFTQFDRAGLAARIKEITAGGCHAVMVCNASSRAYDQALDFLRYAGTLVCVGIPEVDPHPMPNSMPWKIIGNLWKIKGETSAPVGFSAHTHVHFRRRYREPVHGHRLPAAGSQGSDSSRDKDRAHEQAYRGQIVVR